MLLQTKLFIPPTWPSLVPRPRLIAKLNAGLVGKLTLVSAPDGFGKSTLLSAWVQQAKPRPHFAWLSLDEGDNDLMRFLTYFVAALRTIEGNLGKGLLAALQSPGKYFLLQTSILNRVSAPLCDAVIKRITARPSWRALKLPTYSSSRRTTSGFGIAITISLLIYCGRDYINTNLMLWLNYISAPVPATKRTTWKGTLR